VTTLQDSIETAKSAVVSGNYDQAITWCHHIRRRFPKNIDAHWLLAEAYRERGQSDKAEELCLRVLSAAPDNLIARWGLALILEEHNDLQEAVWHLERALEYNPGHAELESEFQRIAGRPYVLTPAGLAHLYLRGGLYYRAAEQFRAAIAVEGEQLEFLVGLAEALWYDRQLEEAQEVAERALADSPDCLKANLIVAFTRRLLEPAREAEVAPYLERARALDATDALLRAMLKEAGLSHIQPPAVATELEMVPSEPQAVAEPAGKAAGVSWLEDTQPLPLDWLNQAVEDTARHGEESEAALEAALLTPSIDQADAAAEVAEEPPASSPRETETGAPTAALAGTEETSAQADEAIASSAPPAPDDWEAIARQMAEAASKQIDEMQPIKPEAGFMSVDEIRVTFGEEWADLLTEEVKLDPEAERRLNDALSELVGEAEPAAVEGGWQPAEPGILSSRGKLTDAPQPAQAGESDLTSSAERSSIEAPGTEAEPTLSEEQPSETRPFEPSQATIAPQADEPDRSVIDSLLHRLEQNPDDCQARLALAAAYQQVDEPESAAAEYRRLIRDVPELVPQLIDNLKWLSHTWPDCAAAHRALGDAYMKLGLFQQAIEEYNYVLRKRQAGQS